MFVVSTPVQVPTGARAQTGCLVSSSACRPHRSTSAPPGSPASAPMTWPWERTCRPACEVGVSCRRYRKGIQKQPNQSPTLNEPCLPSQPSLPPLRRKCPTLPPVRPRRLFLLPPTLWLLPTNLRVLRPKPQKNLQLPPAAPCQEHSRPSPLLKVWEGSWVSAARQQMTDCQN